MIIMNPTMKFNIMLSAKSIIEIFIPSRLKPYPLGSDNVEHYTQHSKHLVEKLASSEQFKKINYEKD